MLRVGGWRQVRKAHWHLLPTLAQAARPVRPAARRPLLVLDVPAPPPPAPKVSDAPPAHRPPPRDRGEDARHLQDLEKFIWSEGR